MRFKESLSSKVDNLSNASSEQSCSTVRMELIEIADAEEIEEADLTTNASHNIVTGLTNQPNASPHIISLSFPPPNQRISDEIIEKLLESLSATNRQNNGLPRLLRHSPRQCLLSTTRHRSSSTLKVCFRPA